MNTHSIEESLSAAELALKDNRGLAGTGFWPAVAEIKPDRGLIERYADRVAVIDTRAFESWALLTVPVVTGTVLATVATLLGLVAIGAAYFTDGWTALVVFTAGFGVVLITTHGLAHLLVGRLAGMRFTHWFVGTVGRPQPGVKVDYSTYLRTDARSRAWMHASGAIVTKAVPFAMIGAAIASGLPSWYSWALASVGTISIVTDVLWSTRASDWKKYRREMGFVQTS